MRESKLRQIHATVAAPHVEYVSSLFIDEVKHKMDIQFCPQNDGRPLYGPQLQRWALMSDPIGLHRYHMVSEGIVQKHMWARNVVYCALECLLDVSFCELNASIQLFLVYLKTSL